MDTKTNYLRKEIEGGILFMILDQPGERMNVLGREMIPEMHTLLDGIEADPAIQAVVLISGKPDNFIAGADIKLFQSLDTPEAMEKFNREGNTLLDRIEAFPKPVIAAMHGTTMGGGMEVALACHYRIGTDHKDTRFALPEVKLGLLPGAGGTQRLPRLVGVPKALDIMLTGKNVYPRQALKMGLLDEMTHKYALRTAALNVAKKLATGWKPKRKIALMDRALTQTFLRGIALKKARETVEAKTLGNYPAPPKIIEAVEKAVTASRRDGREFETRAFTSLVFTPQSRALVNLFFAMTDSKKRLDKSLIGKAGTIGVLGAGLMGSGIADVSAGGGYRVLLKDRDLESAAKGYAGIWQELDKKRGKRIISPFERDRTSSLIHPTGDYRGFEKADLVIEAVFEDLDIKHKVLAEVEAVVPDHCIFASNTSSLPITDIAAGSKRPELVLGMHYFSPVQKMPLLEIIKTKKTTDRALHTAIEVGMKQGKTVIVVNDGPGFYTTRILAPFMNEAMLLLEEGAAIDEIDKAMKKLGFPVGPLVLMDEVGIDVAAHVAGVMGAKFKDRGVEGSKAAEKLSEAGYAGRKNDKGFYTYSGKGGKKKEVNQDVYSFFGGPKRRPVTPAIIQERLLMAMVNEALLCLQDEILLSPADGDLGAILGLGFPPFLGGPFRYIDREGASNIFTRLDKLEGQHGIRFKPAEILAFMAKKSGQFYG
ncbi:MAG: fatty acid oxidation complex subunit alpha FadJ [Balneolaceae bacterium]|nr:MAG: fatty acid oxidation complex subunit alpha FadJ [Balneolaceae bacterium]